ncbi:MAG TPA: MlaD family protein [Edaphobacter sp.]|nr:MlaD family protein [Edaphobacter sp.]
MSSRYFVVGLFIIAGVALFAVGIFLVGNRHEAFSHHLLLYADFADLDGLTVGSKVRVAGMDAGQVSKIDVPGSPNSRFRVQMRINEQLHGLVRTDSIVTVDTEGVVGDIFLSIHPGSPGVAMAHADAILQSKPPVSISDLLTHGLVVMDDADSTLKQVGGKLNVALDGVNGAVGNANDVLVGLKQGRGPAGMLLRDEKMATQIRETLSNAQSATSNLNQASVRVNGLVADIDQRQLPQKVDDTMTQIRSASTDANTTIQQVHQTLNEALGPDKNGVTAGQNISQALTNVNVATGNMAEDTEALKHNFFFKGFFNHRGYYNLSSLSPQEYRRNKLFINTNDHRSWLPADHLFQDGGHGSEELSGDGRRAIDTAITAFGDAVFQQPIVIEGYADAANPADQLALSYTRANLVRTYLQARFPFAANNLGVMPLGATPPSGLGHGRWSGVCILIAMKS